MKFNLSKIVLLAAVFIVAAAGVALSGCLNSADVPDDPNHPHTHDSHADHAHTHDDHAGHAHGDPNAAYDPLDNTSVNQILNGNKILVAASVIPQTEFIEKVGGDRVIVISMIPPGAGHTYDPSPRQLEDLSKADLYLQLGSGEPFETNHMQTFIQMNPNMTVINSSEGLTLIQNGNATDPHIWTSPKCAVVMVENTYRGLAGIDPANASYYRANADAYIAELQVLDAELQNRLSGLRSHDFMVYHPAWGYFSRDYGLTQIAVEVDGKEPAPRDIIKYIDLAQQNNISVIFVQEQVSVAGATAIAEGFGGDVYVIDPLAKEYILNIRHVGQVLADEMS